MGFIVDVAVDLEAAVSAYDDLLDQPAGPLRTASALHHARRLALCGRELVIYAEGLVGLADHVLPHRGIRVAHRLAYAFVALAQDPPDADTLLTRDEVRELLGEPELKAWWGWCLSLADRYGS